MKKFSFAFFLFFPFYSFATSYQKTELDLLRESLQNLREAKRTGTFSLEQLQIDRERLEGIKRKRDQLGDSLTQAERLLAELEGKVSVRLPSIGLKSKVRVPQRSLVEKVPNQGLTGYLLRKQPGVTHWVMSFARLEGEFLSFFKAENEFKTGDILKLRFCKKFQAKGDTQNGFFTFEITTKDSKKISFRVEKRSEYDRWVRYLEEIINKEEPGELELDPSLPLHTSARRSQNIHLPAIEREEKSIKNRVKAEAKTLIRKGFLLKKGDKLKRWHRRYFVFEEGNYLTYYLPSELKYARAVINISNYQRIRENISGKKDKFCFQLLGSKKVKILSFCAETEADRRSWIFVFKKAIVGGAEEAIKVDFQEEAEPDSPKVAFPTRRQSKKVSCSCFNF